MKMLIIFLSGLVIYVTGEVMENKEMATTGGIVFGVALVALFVEHAYSKDWYL